MNRDLRFELIYVDIRTFEHIEDYFTEAKEQGVIFIRFDRDAPPDVQSSSEGMLITVKDHILQQNIEIRADLVALSAGMVAEDTTEVSQVMKLNRNTEGY